MWCRVALCSYMAMYRRHEYRLGELLLVVATAIAQLLGREMLLSATRLTLYGPDLAAGRVGSDLNTH